MTDRAGIAPDASTVAMNVTAVDAADAGFATVFPCGQDRPTASNLNYASGGTVAAAVFAGVGDDGEVCIYTSASTGLLVDAFAVVPDTTYVPLPAPRRVADTRTPNSTFDGEAAGGGRQPGDGTLQLEVAGRVEVPADAGSVVLTVTAVNTAAPGFVTVHPAGTGLPDASVLNHTVDDTVANTVVARVGAGGDVCVFTSATTDVVVDVAGWLPGPSAASDTGDCPATPPTALVEQWTAQLAAGQFDGAVATSGLTADEIRAQFPGPTPPSGDDPAVLLNDYCWYTGGLCVTPTSIDADSDAGTVTAIYQPEEAQFTVDVDSDGSITYELPPTSADQRRSSCARFELVEPTTWTSTATSAPDSVPGVVWNNNPRPGTTPSGDVNMTWASADSMPYCGTTTAYGTHDGAGFTWELSTIEGGVQATTVADPPAGCGRYTVWTYATGSDTTAITSFLDNLQRR